MADPPGGTPHPVSAGEVDADLPAILNIPRRGLIKWLSALGGGVHKGGSSLFCGSLFFIEELLKIVKIVSTLHGEGETVDELPQEVCVNSGVVQNDVADRSWRQGPSLDLGNEALLGVWPVETPDEVVENKGVKVGVVGDSCLYLCNGKGAWASE